MMMKPLTNGQPMHSSKIWKALLITGFCGTLLMACGNGGQKTTEDSIPPTNSMDTAMMTPDTAPGAEMPPGAINPGEDSSRYGTGTADSSKNRSGNGGK